MRRLAVACSTLFFSLALSRGAEAQRLLIVNCEDGELARWPNWTAIDRVRSEAFLAMTDTNLRTYDVIEISHCVDHLLETAAARQKIVNAVRAGVSLYSTSFNLELPFVPGNVTPSGVDTCVDAVTIPAGSRTHALVTQPNPDLSDADLSNVGCAVHGSFETASSEYVTIARSVASNFATILAGTLGCGRIFLRSQHYHVPTEARAVRFINSVAAWLNGGTAPAGADRDGDGVDDACDVCANVLDPMQSDCDGDGIGDACDTQADVDNDDIADACDTCPGIANPIQPRDTDVDGVDDACDVCPNAYDALQADCDGDGVGDACDTDRDGDRRPDICDNCPDDPNPFQYDGDADGTGDSCELVSYDFDFSYFDDVTLFQPEADVNNNFPSIQIFRTAQGIEKAGLVRFDTRGIPAGSEVVSARMHIFQTVKQPVTVANHFALEPWGENVVTWNSFRHAYDPIVESTHLARMEDNDIYVDIDVTSIVRGHVDGSRPNYGFYMRALNVGAVRFGATERAALGRRPRMFVDVRTPESAPLLLVAEGARGKSGALYWVNGSTGQITEVGGIGFGLTGMATAPDGRIYGTTATRGRYGELITIDPRNAAGATVGALDDGRVNHPALPDCTFRGDTLYCWTERSDSLVTVDPESGQVSRVGGNHVSFGSGLAADGGGTLYLAPEGPRGHLYVVDPVTGATRATVRLSGNRESISAMTFYRGALYAIEHDGTTWDLIRVDPATGAVTTIGTMPPFVDALTTLEHTP